MLRAWVPELTFHDDFKPVLSLDCHPSGRFVTAGVDHHIRVWRLDPSLRSPDGCPHIDFLSQPPDSGDPKPINVVRFSPTGDLFAVGSDNATITLYSLNPPPSPPDSSSTPLPIPNEAPSAPDIPSVEPMDIHPPLPGCAPGDTTPEPSQPCPAREEGKELRGEGKEERAVIELDRSVDGFTPTPTTPPRLTSSPDSPASPIPAAFDADVDFTSLNVETYQRIRVLRGHLQEVYALSFSPCSAYLLSGSIDGRVHVWDVASGRSVRAWEDHHGYVQGVAWDPLGAFIVSVSSDRTVKVYQRRRPRGKDPLDCCPLLTLKTRRLPPVPKPPRDEEVVASDQPVGPPAIPAEGAGAASGTAVAMTAPLFVDETLPSFFRRPAWSPCGGWLLLPCGVVHEEGKTVYCSWLYNRENLGTPVACLPHPEPSVACAFSPFPYQPPPSSPAAAPASMPVTLLFCVATTKSVLLYSTHCLTPLGYITSLHLSALTEVAWCRGGVTDTTDRLLVSSSDGYVSVIEMEGIAVKLAGEELNQWRAGVNRRREEIQRSWDAVESDTELKAKRKKKKSKAKAGDAAVPAVVDPLNAALPPVGEGVEGKMADGEEKTVKVVEEFVLTEEMLVQLTAMVEGGHKITKDAVRIHCEVSGGRAQKMARKWKELQRAKKRSAAEVKAAQAKEEKASAATASGEGAAEKSEKAKTEKSAKEKKKSTVDDVKKMKKLDMFFSKSIAPVFFEPSLPRLPPAVEGEVKTPAVYFSSSSSYRLLEAAAQTGETAPTAAPLPLPPSDGRVKRKIAPTLVDDAVLVSVVPTAVGAPQPAVQRSQTATGKQKGKGKSHKMKPGPKKKQRTTVPAAKPHVTSTSLLPLSSSSSPLIDLTGDVVAQMAPPPDGSSLVAPAILRRSSGGHRVMLSPPASDAGHTQGKPVPPPPNAQAQANAILIPVALSTVLPSTTAAVSSFFTPRSEAKRQKRTIVPLSVPASEGTQQCQEGVTAAAETLAPSTSMTAPGEAETPASGGERRRLEVEPVPV